MFSLGGEEGDQLPLVTLTRSVVCSCFRDAYCSYDDAITLQQQPLSL